MEPWTDDGEEPRLLGVRCEACGATFYPKPTLCSACFSPNLAAYALSARGELYVYSRIHVTTPKQPRPYVVAYVDLPDGLRIFGHLDAPDGADPGPVSGAVAVYRGAIGVSSEGSDLMGVRFRRVEPQAV